MPTTIDHILNVLGTGLPVLLTQLGATVALLCFGVFVYELVTPFSERRLVAEGNVAGGITLAGAVLALAIPLAATLATSTVLADIVIWGLVALMIQIVTFVVIAVVFRGLKRQIEADNVAAALSLAAAQIAVALLNAGAMAR